MIRRHCVNPIPSANWFCLFLHMQWRLLFLTTGIFISLYPLAQPAAYPRSYFRNPLGIPIDLTANFGELRPSHWHMGLDIRTNQKENLPVYAAADGYVAFIGVRPQSFGRFMIINHPNGLSTLYAHLNDFSPALEQYVTEQQYRKQSWAVELNFTKDQFPVTKGAFIAYSGNTGGSQGPHLHFEIFDTRTEKRLNPLLFDLSPNDKVPPTLVRLAMYDRGRSLYEQEPVLYPLKNTESGYIISKNPAITTGLNRIGFAIQAYDRMSNSGNQNGIFSASLYFDDVFVSGFTLDSIDYDETLYIDAQVDYRYKYNGGAWLQQLSPLPGVNGGPYKKAGDAGIIILSDTALHSVRIDVKDAAGNAAAVNFRIRHDDSLFVQPSVYNTAAPLAPGQVNLLERPGFELYFGKDCLYDSLRPVYYRNNLLAGTAVSAIHQVNDASIPLHSDVIVRIKPDRTIPFEWQDKLLIRRSDRKGNSVRKAVWEEKWLSARFGDLGSFQLLADTVAPFINELGRGDTIDLSPASRILFTPSDNMGAIRKFRAELDGQWIRFTNDKSRNWIYIFDDRCPFGVHELKVTAEDLVGNTTTKSWWFKRYPYTPPKKKLVKKKKKVK